MTQLLARVRYGIVGYDNDEDDDKRDPFLALAPTNVCGGRRLLATETIHCLSVVQQCATAREPVWRLILTVPQTNCNYWKRGITNGLDCDSRASPRMQSSVIE